MTTITAQMLAKTHKDGTRTPARERVFTCDESGRWSGAEEGPMLESEVIDICKRARNWSQIRAAHFPMYGFSA